VTTSPPSIGVLALQGGFAPHARAIERLGARPVLVRAPRDLEGVSALVLPGGESTVQLRLLESSGLEGPLEELLASGKPVLATCAGLILLATHVTNPKQRSLRRVDVTLARNAWGRQLDSFEATSDDGGHPLVFIRAPRITATGPGVEVLATLRGEPVLVRQGAITGATFHPELTEDLSVHRVALAEALPATSPA
jgi:5'-phosphate synthase pdxT subunit